MSSPTVWTVGHSNLDLETFLALVEQHEIAYLVDVRSYPYSRFVGHFNREPLRGSLEERGIHYVFLGEALGGRPQREDQFDAEGHARYDEMAKEPSFTDAIDRVLQGAGAHRLALMCSCGRPHECHRRLLVGKVLCGLGAELRHILSDFTVASETSVPLEEDRSQKTLFEQNEPRWRSAQSVSHRRQPSTSSAG